MSCLESLSRDQNSLPAPYLGRLSFDREITPDFSSFPVELRTTNVSVEDVIEYLGR